MVDRISDAVAILNGRLGWPLWRLKRPKLAILIRYQRIRHPGLCIGGLAFGSALRYPGQYPIDLRLSYALGADLDETQFGRHLARAKFLGDQTIVGFARRHRSA